MKLVYVNICFHAARVYRHYADKLPVQNYSGTVVLLRYETCSQAGLVSQ